MGNDLFGGRLSCRGFDHRDQMLPSQRIVSGQNRAGQASFGADHGLYRFGENHLVGDLHHALPPPLDPEVALGIQRPHLTHGHEALLPAGLFAGAQGVAIEEVGAAHPDLTNISCGFTLSIHQTQLDTGVGAAHRAFGRIGIGQRDKTCLCRAVENMHCRLGAEPPHRRPGRRIERAAAAKDQAQRWQRGGGSAGKQAQLGRRGVEDRRPGLGDPLCLSPGGVIRQHMRIEAKMQRFQHRIER